jgi:S1-C subfamily serine protease
MLVAVIVVVAMVAVAFLGVMVQVWRSPSSSTPMTLPGVIPSSVPQGSSAAGAPANAAAIADRTGPGLVDIDVIDTAEGVGGAGTGMVMSAAGEVLTCNHVIEGATTIDVTDVGNGETYRASVVGYDRSHDVAVLKLSGASGLKSVKIGTASKVSTGDGVVAIGNAEGTGGTPIFAGGSVTATDQTITAEDQVTGATEQLSGMIETNAMVVPGDSGGALVNGSGQVIGMIAAASQSFQFQASANQGYAVPLDEADSIARQIVAGNTSSSVHVGPTAFLGVEVQSPLSGSSGAEIVEVVPGSPAANAGLVQGDTITAVAGQAISSPQALADVLQGEHPGSSARVQYLNPEGVASTVTMRLVGGPAQ